MNEWISFRDTTNQLIEVRASEIKLIIFAAFNAPEQGCRVFFGILVAGKDVSSLNAVVDRETANEISKKVKEVISVN